MVLVGGFGFSENNAPGGTPSANNLLAKATTPTKTIEVKK